MFNMVNTQSLLAAGMVRDHELSHPLQMQALAMALAQILAATENCGAVAVDIPYAKKPQAQEGSGSNTNTASFGATNNLDDLKNLLNKGAADPNPSSSDQHLTAVLDMLGEHINDLTKNYSELSQNTMTVT
ncbi:hypothetical protein BEN30_15795 [Magnetovibrio blakemorei]|uniref:Uncharacterized protein n=2 Tax=Magnetovibrio blakemorei TaxID=28181 RepID=A0A1E5Q4T9_9PROT|nr:hypothetical protein BEN30_15795 [Magnetovibrio blakemorei]